ncbi:MAG: hypothetical protein LBR86_01005, partial [Tannerella sp.]|nr:hypothetical protein [Tannerella sp.]
YYYVEITNTNTGAGITGLTVVTATSRAVEVTVSQPPTPVIRRSVTLDVSPHFLSDPPAGVSYVQSGRDLVITLTPQPMLPAGHVPQVTTDRDAGVTVTRNADGTWTVCIRQIRQALTVTITTVGASTATGQVAAAQAWSHSRRLYIAATQAGEAYVYNVAGIRVKTVAVVAGATVAEALPAGVYIVALEGKRYKVSVR